MTFKDWLIAEAGGGGHGSDFFYGLQLYPSDAYDYSWANNEPTELFFLQKRWKIEKGWGRKFHNIDEPKFQRTTNYVSVKSSMPEAGSGFWEHKPDDGSGYIKPVTQKNLTNLAIGKNSKDKRELRTSNEPVSIDVDGLFGDKGTNSVPQLSDTFDKPWTKVYEQFGLDVMGQGTTGINNTNLGVRSKYIGPDETGEGEVKPTKIANFGMGRRRKSKKYMRKHK